MLKDLLGQNLIQCSPDTSVREIAERMKDEDIGAIVVVENNQAVGIVTDRDLALRCLAEGQSVETSQARDVMTEGIVSVSENAGLVDIIAQMKTAEVRRVVIVGADERPLGLISFGDIYRLLASEISSLASPAAPDEAKLESTRKVEKAA